MSIVVNNIKGKISAVAGAAFAFTVVAVAAVSVPVPTGVNTSRIALTFEKQGVTLVGDFAGLRQNAYIIITEMGELHVPASYVTCKGASCFEVATIEVGGS